MVIQCQEIYDETERNFFRPDHSLVVDTFTGQFSTNYNTVYLWSKLKSTYHIEIIWYIKIIMK